MRVIISICFSLLLLVSISDMSVEGVGFGSSRGFQNRYASRKSYYGQARASIPGIFYGFNGGSPSLHGSSISVHGPFNNVISRRPGPHFG